MNGVIPVDGLNLYRLIPGLALILYQKHSGRGDIAENRAQRARLWITPRGDDSGSLYQTQMARVKHKKQGFGCQVSGVRIKRLTSHPLDILYEAANYRSVGWTPCPRKSGRHSGRP